MENTEKTKTETTKIDGISAQINLSPGSETHRRFAQLMKERGIATSRAMVDYLMDALDEYRNSADSNEEIVNTINDLRSEIASYEATLQKKDLEITDLQQQLETARNEANENAVNGLGKQAQIEDLQKKLDGAIIVKPNPVSRFFLAEMAGQTQTTAGKILEKLFMDDLQNPRANNLPYTVSASRIREVMEELKQQQQ